MSTEIDRLDIAIETQARQALNDVNNLYEGLRNISRALGGMKLSNFERLTAQLQTLSRIDLSNLSKKLDFNIKLDGTDVQKTEEAVRTSAGRISQYLSRAAKNMADEYNIASKTVRKEIEAIFQSMAGGGKAATSAASTQRIADASSFSRGEFSRLIGEDLGIATYEWENFLRHIEQNKILYTSDVKDMAKYTQTLAGYADNVGNIVSRSGNINLDTGWEELIKMFPTVMASASNVGDAVGDKFEKIVELVRQARQETERFSPMDDVHLGEDATTDWLDNFVRQLNVAREGVKNIVEETKSTLPGNKIMLDVGINEEKFKADIEKAIQSAANKKYDLPIKLNIDIDRKALVNTVQGEIDSIQTTNLDKISQSYREMANAVASFNTTSGGEGFTKMVNALKRLASLDTRAFEADKFTSMTNSLMAIAQVPDVSNIINRVISAIARLASSGASIQAAAQALPALSNALTQMMWNINNAGFIEKGTMSLVSAITRLATSGTKGSDAAASIPALTSAVLDFFRAMQSAPKVNSQTVKMTSALADLAANGNKIDQAGQKVQNAYNGMAKSSQSAVSKIASGAKSLVSHFTHIGNGASKIQKATLSLKNLLQVALGFYGIRSLFNWGKEAVNLASDLTEVQNVVENSFGTKGTEAVEEFAKTSIESFGMSELTAKQMASRFQAMGNAMGITAGQVASATSKVADRMNPDIYDTTAEAMGAMSLNLTKLAADMASFYNAEQSDVATALNSIYTGQTRPLRQYGLDLTQATLQEWALKNGIDADVQSMTQAQKTLLRYQYVMANTASVQGDFARTSQTWANQTRILKQNFEVLGKTIGNVLINVFRPLVVWLNNALSHVIAFAETIGNALGKIFGWKIFHTPASTAADALGDLSESLDDAGVGGSDAADGVNDAADAVKKLERTILGFDEINKLNEVTTPATNSGTGGPGSGGSGGAGAGTVDGTGADFQIEKMKSWFEEYKSSIQTLYGLGKYISDALSDAMESINWDDIYKKARNFGSGLASFLNGLISPRLFGNLGTTIANSLNTALYFLNSFGETFSWWNFGNSIATGINKFFDNFDFSLLASTFSTWALGIFETINTALEKINWRKIGWQIRTFFVQIKWKEILQAVGTAIGNALNLAIELAKGMLSSDGLEDNAFTKALDKIKTSASKFMDAVDWSKIANAISRIVSALKPAAEGFAAGFVGFFEQLSKIGAVTLNLIGAAFETLAGALENMDPAVIEAIGRALGVIAGAMVTMKIATGVLDTVKKFVGTLTGAGAAIGTAGASIGEAATKSTLLGTAASKAKGLLGKFGASALGTSTGWAALIVGALHGGAALQSVVDSAQGGDGTVNRFKTAVLTLGDELANVVPNSSGLDEAIRTLAEDFGNGTIGADELREGLVTALTDAGVSAEEAQQAFGNFRLKMVEMGSDIPDEEMDKLEEAISHVGTTSENTSNNALSKLASAFGFVSGDADDAKEKAGLFKSGIWGMAGGMAAQGILIALLGTVFGNIGTKAEDTGDKITGIEDDVKTAATTFKTWSPTAKKNAEGMANDVINGWTAPFEEREEENKDLAHNMFGVFADAFTGPDGFDSHSPSKKSQGWAKDVIDGFAIGITNNTQTAITQINSLLLKITNAVDTFTSSMEGKGKTAVSNFEKGLKENTISATVNNLFNGISFKSFNSNMKTAGENAVGAFKSGMQNVHLPIPHLNFSYSLSGNGSTGYRYSYNSGISWYALGGFPNTGELFYANENGPEMVGKMGRRNVVANNAQITNGIKAAVVDGMMEVAMSGAFGGGSSDSTPYIINATLKTENDEVLARAVQRGQMRRNSRFSPVATTI